MSIIPGFSLLAINDVKLALELGTDAINQRVNGVLL